MEPLAALLLAAGRIADADLANRVDALGPDPFRSALLGDPTWREDPLLGWTNNGRLHFSTIRRRHDGRWGFSGELAVLGSVGARLGLVPRRVSSGDHASRELRSRVERGGWTEVDQLTRADYPCFERQEGRRRALVAFTTFNKTFVPAWCGGGDLYLCLHAATLLA